MFTRIGRLAVVGLMAVLTLAACGGEKEKTNPTVTRVPASNATGVTPTAAATVAATPAAGSSPAASPAATGAATPVGTGAASPVASPAAVSPASPAAAPPASPVASPEAGGVAAAQTINLEDITFNPKELTIPANTAVTINLVNRGVTVHTFDVDALNAHSGTIASRASTTITINAPAGTYQYYCAIPGHKEAGMVGTLTVR